MNECERFQKTISADPDQLDAELARHDQACERCAVVATRARKFDEQIRAALDIDVPGDLVQSLAQIPDRPHRSGKKIRNAVIGGFALAASFLLGVGLTIQGTGWLPPEQPVPLQELVYNHILGEPQALNAIFPAKSALVNTTLKDFGIELNESLGDVLHVTVCPIGDTHGLHLVVQGQNGPVTLLFLPTRTIDGRESFAQGRFVGFIQPAPAGVVAIVGEKGEPLEKIETRVKQSMEWL